MKLLKLMCISVLIVAHPVNAGDESSTQAYAALQNCMAEAFDVVDNGSFEQYCIEQYMIKTREEE